MSLSKKKSNGKTYQGILLGVDPGLTITGYGVLEYAGEDIRVKEAGCIRTGIKHSMTNRLAEIYDGLNEVIHEFCPDFMVIEDLYSHYRHPKTAIIMGHARGAVFLSAAAAGIPVKSYGATMVKKALTGNGRASKIQVQRMIKNRLGLAKIPEPPDVADALAVALCHISHENHWSAGKQGRGK